MIFGKILTPAEAAALGVRDTYVAWTPSAKQAAQLQAAKLKEAKSETQPAGETPPSPPEPVKRKREPRTR